MEYEVMIAKHKPIEVNAFTFGNVSKMFDDKNEEGVFKFNGAEITKTPDETFKIKTQNNEVDFTSEHLLIVDGLGNVYSFNQNAFFQSYEVVSMTKATIGNKDV